MKLKQGETFDNTYLFERRESMKEVKNTTERRRFLKYALGVGTTIWLTPAIITISAKKGHACLSDAGSSLDSISKAGGSWDKWDKGNSGGNNGGSGGRGRGRGRGRK
jgi:hypothetical protein